VASAVTLSERIGKSACSVKLYKHILEVKSRSMRPEKQPTAIQDK
jgi:hypothetical protein